jgi:hypothetical protein
MIVKKIVLIALLFVAGCASKPATSTSTDSPSGSWSGEYGPGSSLRDSIRVDLRWENGDLRGVVHAGPRSMPITKASFQRDTGAITMEFDAEGNGRTTHYVAEGKVNGSSMAGTWSHDDQRGEFRVTKE